jgi:two-component system invasion response regulator UvrY
VVDEASDGVSALEKIKSRRFDVIILDLSMPGLSGLDIITQLGKKKANPPIIIYSSHPEEHYAERLLKAGASGYLTKDKAPEELVKAIRCVFRGGKYITTTLACKIATSYGKDDEGPIHEKLSNREFQVMCMIASGKTVSEIAVDMYLSTKTISTYRSRVLEKMVMANNSQLTNYAIKNKLIE